MLRPMVSSLVSSAVLLVAISTAVMTTSSTASAGDGQWILSPESSTPPSGRMYFGYVHDTARDRLVVVGGHPQFLNDVWALPLSGPRQWTQLAPAGVPPLPRWGHTAIYDAGRDQIVVFGGTFGTETNETWILSLASGPEWSLANAPGQVPSGRRNHTCIYDPEGDRMILFGGFDGAEFVNDVWELRLDSMTWKELKPKGKTPSGRDLMTAIYDPKGHRLVVYGGWNGRDYEGDMWTLDLEKKKPKWHEIKSGSEKIKRHSRRQSRKSRSMHPGARRDYSVAYDPIEKRMLLFGGTNGDNLGDLWAFGLGKNEHWKQIETTGTGPSPRFADGAIFDPSRGEFIVFGGYDGNYRSDVHVLATSTNEWSEPITGAIGTRPSERREYVTALDPDNDRALFFGGASGAGDLNDLWALTTSGPPTWTRLHGGIGPAPTRRHGVSGALDPVSGDLIIVGGYDNNYRNDVWRFSSTTGWSQVFPAGGPPAPRMYSSMVYDAARDRFVVFGGHPQFLNDTWVLSLRPTPTWTQLATGGGLPRPRWGHVAIMDQARDRMIVFGGLADLGGEKNDAWSLSFASGSSQWIPLFPAGPLPPPLRNLGAAFDAARNRMVIFGGFDGVQFHNGTYALSLSSPAWRKLLPGGAPPSGRDLMSILYDDARDRIILFGGWAATEYKNDLWTLEGFTPARAQVIPVSQATIPTPFSVRVQNPVRNGRLSLSLRFPVSGEASIDLIDVSGRRVLSQRISDVRSGARELELDLRNRVSPGVYFVRVAQNADVRSTRVVMIR